MMKKIVLFLISSILLFGTINSFANIQLYGVGNVGDSDIKARVVNVWYKLDNSAEITLLADQNSNKVWDTTIDVDGTDLHFADLFANSIGKEVTLITQGIDATNTPRLSGIIFGKVTR